MTARAAIAGLLRGVGRDAADCRALQDLLEAQFAAALRHQTERVAELAAQVSAQVDNMEARRLERVALLRALVGPGAPMTAVYALLDPQPRAALQTGWDLLERGIRECKRLNARNCELLMTQHEIMQRVLHGEAQTYAPA